MFEILNPIGDIEFIIKEYITAINFFSKYRYGDEIEKRKKPNLKNEIINLGLRMEYQNYQLVLHPIQHFS